VPNFATRAVGCGQARRMWRALQSAPCTAATVFSVAGPWATHYGGQGTDRAHPQTARRLPMALRQALQERQRESRAGHRRAWDPRTRISLAARVTAADYTQIVEAQFGPIRRPGLLALYPVDRFLLAVRPPGAPSRRTRTPLCSALFAHAREHLSRLDAGVRVRDRLRRRQARPSTGQPDGRQPCGARGTSHTRRHWALTSNRQVAAETRKLAYRDHPWARTGDSDR